ncbi:MAG: DUF3090 family protein [Chloroflexota bacterium]|nr:MAG: DUF3090 family protein [Chloroflexota bacterium]
MIDFGPVDALDAEAIGPPGRRVFRLRARVGDQYASLWLEKESVVALGRSFSALLAERSKMRGRRPDPVEDVGNFPQAAQVDIHIARLGLDWDGTLEHIIVLADDAEAVESGDTPSFRMAIDRSHALRCIDQFHEVVVGGRPTCALCHEALEFVDQPHFCPGSNGHTVEIPLPPLESQ